jgi:catabolite regulation protein CreA
MRRLSQDNHESGEEGDWMKENSLAVFEGKQIRRYYDEERETWYFSVVDIIQVLIQQSKSSQILE